MTPPNGVKYVPFGGAQVPEGCKREVINQNGQKLYCVWTDDKGGKVTYPEQQNYSDGEFYYTYSDEKITPYMQIARDNKSITKQEFDLQYSMVKCTGKPDKYCEDCYTDVISSGPGSDQHVNRIITKRNGEVNVSKFYVKGAYFHYEDYNKVIRDTTPKIETTTDSGIIFDTQRTTLSNMRGATVTGSSNEDEIVLDNSSNCSVDVSKDNNNIFVSDNVTVINGQGNKIIAGDHDIATMQTHNYETNTTTTDKEYKGKGTHKQ